ncbi:MAG TPA: STAS domain-containing protein [Cryptosporangiaceae bacterium]|nr:STAS domain-containing protein [Cryptosporangiaceae bacterium]
MVDQTGAEASAEHVFGEVPETALTMDQDRSSSPGRTVVRVSGEIDMLTAPRLRDEVTPLVTTSGADIVVDLDQVTFLGSNGLGVLVELSQQADAAGSLLRLVCANRTVTRPLTLTGLDQVLELHDSHQDLPAVRS